jgi:hypothetical protein
MDLKLLLEKVYARIEDPKHWCKGSMAKDLKGNSVSEVHPSATSYCLVGDIALVTFQENAVDQYDYIMLNFAQFLLSSPKVAELINHHPYMSPENIIARFNDKADHKKVLSALRQFIDKWNPEANMNKRIPS